MNTLKQYLLLLFFMNFSFIFSQENISKSIIDPLQKDALYREKVFIHVNKTIYFPNENIWLTAYVGEDKNNVPSSNTSNLHVNLLNQQGDVVESKTLFIKNGVGIGDFSIKEKYKSGKYYIQGYTNYMLNFGNENAFIQEIELINPVVKNETKQQKNDNFFDVQIFPESGYLLEDAENIIGIKVLINGMGYPFTGKIINSKGLDVTTFEGNYFGMSKCEFNYSKNETYTAVVKVNNIVKKIDLPKANKTGVIFTLDNTLEENVKITLKTNKETLPSLKNESLAILFYRNNFISEAVTLSLKNSQETTQELFFNKSKMQNGVNIVTLFKNNQPIAERKFFVDKPHEQTAVLIEELKTENDSINYKIQTVYSDYKSISAKLSISVLTNESKVFQENQNIISAFLLSPYVKGNIENPSYYFKNEDPKEKEFLDLLLINQGWSTYSLQEKIKEINPEKLFNFESGFTLNGKIKKETKGYDLGILSKENRLVAFSKFNSNLEFSFENVFAYKNEPIKIALIKKNMPLVKPSKVSFIKEPIKNKNYSFLTNKYNINMINDGGITPSLENNKQVSNVEHIDEIFLKTVFKKNKKTINDLEMKLASKHKVLAAEFYKGKKVTEKMEDTHQTLYDYFQFLGYIKHTDWGSDFISLRNAQTTLIKGGISERTQYTRKTNGLDVIEMEEQGRNTNATYPPKIYINDISILDLKDGLAILKETQMKNIDEILINKSGAGGGLEGSGGVIKIYLKKGNHQYFEEVGENLYENLVLLTGFDKATNYYNPKYEIKNENFYNWTEIDWINNLKTNEKGEAFIKIPTNKFSNDFQFIINGISNDGLLFNTIYKTDDIGTF